jgi:hypothetical protein
MNDAAESRSAEKSSDRRGRSADERVSENRRRHRLAQLSGKGRIELLQQIDEPTPEMAAARVMMVVIVWVMTVTAMLRARMITVRPIRTSTVLSTACLLRARELIRMGSSS